MQENVSGSIVTLAAYYLPAHGVKNALYRETDTMGDLIQLHDARASSDSAAAGAIGERAANSVNKSADSPAESALLERNIGSHHSDGMVLRSDHLRTASRVCPISEAISSNEPQSATTSRKFETMENDLGHLVPKCKANLSHDHNKKMGHNVLLMPNKRQPSTALLRGICARTKFAREALGVTQEQMATWLLTVQGTYKHWEKRTPIPRDREALFCHHAGVTRDWLVNNVGNPPLRAKQKPKRGPKPRVA